MKDEQYETRHIPANFESGITIIGMSFSIRFLIEGAILGMAGGFATYLYLASVKIGDKATLIGVSLAIGALLLVFGLKGINDEPISLFIINLLKFSKGKQTAYYNPRVKTEAKAPISDENEPSSLDRISTAIENIKEKIKENSAKRAESRTESETLDEIIIFEDDLPLKEQNRPKNERKWHAKKGK